MTDTSAQTDQPVIAEGVDEEPVEANRRLFEGWRFTLMAALAAAYAAFHMAALNGLSISEWTGITIPFLPTFPLETWNFRIVHVAGALFMGFLLFSAHLKFADEDIKETPLWTFVGYALLVPALIACFSALNFASRISAGEMWNGIAPEFRNPEIFWFGIPLLIATFGGILLGWLHKSPRGRYAVPDIVLGICGIAVATYLITIFGTLMRNSTGTPFAPIGISLAAVAGTALIMELTRRVAGLALIIIAGIFLVYVFTGHLMPGFLNSPQIDWARFFSQVYTDAGILGPTTAVSSTYIILFII
ncbi:MAG: TRAP transporter permease, partial [Boseongicola sp.]|nr:TRAP transporter permease [Boseongicola sp.]